MENKKIVVKYYLTQDGQKAEILAGRTGESERTASLVIDDEMLGSKYIEIDPQGELSISKSYPSDGWLCGFGGYDIQVKENKYFASPRRIDVYTSDTVLTDEEITEIYRKKIVKKYTDQIVEEYNLRVEADIENQRRDKIDIDILMKLYSEKKLYYRKDNGQWELYFA